MFAHRPKKSRVVFLLKTGNTSLFSTGTDREAEVAATILLVDADLIDRADWQALLQFHGYKVVAVQNGRAALEQFSAIRPDLILIDLGLMDIPGNELSRRIREDPRYARTPILLMGPYSERFKPHQRSSEMAGEFGRPSSREEVFHRVQSILGGSTGLLFGRESDSFPELGRGAGVWQASKS